MASLPALFLTWDPGTRGSEPLPGAVHFWDFGQMSSDIHHRSVTQELHPDSPRCLPLRPFITDDLWPPWLCSHRMSGHGNHPARSLSDEPLLLILYSNDILVSSSIHLKEDKTREAVCWRESHSRICSLPPCVVPLQGAVST